MPAPVMMIGLDACDHGLVWRWAEQGRLPHFSSLIEEGAICRLTSFCEVLQGSVWPTFATSRDPAQHGMYYMLQVDEDRGGLKRMRAGHFKCPPFWSGLRKDGKKAVVIDVPKMGLVTTLDGAQVVEWGAMDHYSSYSTEPASLGKALLDEFGRHVLLEHLEEPQNVQQDRALLAGLIKGVEAKNLMGQALFDRIQPDLFISVFAETHPAGHYFWHSNDEASTRSDAGEIGEALFEVYAAVDRAVGELVRKYRDTTNLLFFSGHGMVVDDYPKRITDEILVRMEMTAKRSKPGFDLPKRETNSRAGWLKSLETSVRRFANAHVLPRSWQQQLWLRNLQKDIDIAGSRAWALPTDLQGFIRVNLKGRDPGGTVATQQYLAVVDEIAEVFEGLVNAESGRPIVDRVYRTRQHFSDSPHTDLLPDLCIMWNNETVTKIRSPRLGEFRVSSALERRSGNHRPEGFCIAIGPGIDTEAETITADLRDLGPTALSLIGAEIPPELSGRVLPFVRNGG